MALLVLVQHWSYVYRSGDFQHAAELVSPWRHIWIMVTAGVLATGTVWLLKRYFRGRNSDVPKAIWFRSGRLPFVRTIIEALLSMTIVGMGASLGREGAPKQVGAAVASALSGWARLTPAETRFLVACGAGAGMGAVYNVPLGGALFALEILLGTLSLPLILPAITASFVATVVAWITLPNHATYVVANYAFTSGQLVWALVFGPLSGMAAVFFVRMIIWAERHKPSGGWPMLAPLLMFTALGCVAIELPQLLGNGKDVTELAFTDKLGVPLLLALIFLKPLATAGCLGSGAPGGLFTPSVTIGAALGGFFGHLWSLAWPGATPGSYAVIGAGAVLAATTQAPVSSIVLLLEMTHHTLGIIVPILSAVIGAAITARLLDRRSLYSGPVQPIRATVQTPAEHPGIPYQASICTDIEVISIASSYQTIIQRLLDLGQARQILYVLDDRGMFAGRILPADVMTCHPLARVLNTGAAADLVTPVTCLLPTMTPAEVERRLERESTGELPVVDALGGALLGVVRRKT
ncbi:MAG: chloride channel protein [Pseudomonadota bacterium]|nr:chloride channel protein [Pseudomonadota bacterium]